MVIIGQLIINDFSKGSNNMKGLEPAVNKKFRRLFKNTGYETYLINEFRTSYKKMRMHFFIRS